MLCAVVDVDLKCALGANERDTQDVSDVEIDRTNIRPTVERNILVFV